jgi:site-specific DNA-cytosine methylase
LDLFEGKDVWIAHALLPGFETYSTGWLSVLIQALYKSLDNTVRDSAMRCLELFCGIGGFAASFPEANIVKAVDIDAMATRVYRANFSHPCEAREIASLPTDWFGAIDADMWWMSPPCTPFSRRGNFHDLADPRSKALSHLVNVVCDVRPMIIGIENVVGFEDSQAFSQLRSRWSREGYRIEVCQFCPTQIGWPNRRPRVYILASIDPKIRLNRTHEIESKVSVADMLVDKPEDSITDADLQLLWLPVELANQYKMAIDKVDISDRIGETACFTSSYGRTVIRSGSYLRVGDRYRRFVPREVARLLGFDDSFQLPPFLDLRTAWRLLGNSLSLKAVRHVFRDVFP